MNKSRCEVEMEMMSSNAMKKSIDVNVSSILKLFTNILLHFLSIQIEFPIISRKI